MTDDLSLDPSTVDAQLDELPRDPWLERRMLTIGASEVPALYLAMGLVVPEEEPPKWLAKLATQLLASKATGKAPASRADGAAARGNDVEEELLEEWNSDPFNGWPRFHHSKVAPREWFPLVDRRCPKLSCTPDAWTWQRGRYINGQVKATVRLDATLGSWYHRLQVQAEMAVLDSDRSLLIYGPGWAASWGQRAKPVGLVVERDEAEIQRIRSAVVAGWALVEERKGAR